jgi:hypothetical protein
LRSSSRRSARNRAGRYIRSCRNSSGALARGEQAGHDQGDARRRGLIDPDHFPSAACLAGGGEVDLAVGADAIIARRCREASS